MMGRAADCEDIVQDAFIKLWTNPGPDPAGTGAPGLADAGRIQPGDRPIAAKAYA